MASSGFGRRLLGLVLVGLVGASALNVSCAGCARRSLERPRVAVTVFPLYDIARRVAKDRLDVQLVLPPGADVHGYEPRPRDVETLAESSLIFAVGLGLDGWAQDLATSAGAGEARVFELGPLMDPILTPTSLAGNEPLIDAHFWLDPIRAQRAVDVIVEALGSLDPSGGPFYRASGEELRRSFQAVHEETAERASMWRSRKIVTQHGSLFYFADRYDLEVVGVVEPVPGQEPTARHLTALIDLLEATEPPALLSEPQMDTVLIRALARETGVTPHEVDPMGGRPGTESYEQIMKSLTDAVGEALR